MVKRRRSGSSSDSREVDSRPLTRNERYDKISSSIARADKALKVAKKREKEKVDRALDPTFNSRRKFGTGAKLMAWSRGCIRADFNPNRWRVDKYDALVFRKLNTKEHGFLTFQWDHIQSLQRNGLTIPENCQILNSKINLFKSGGQNPPYHVGRHHSYEIREISQNVKAAIEAAAFGNVTDGEGNIITYCVSEKDRAVFHTYVHEPDVWLSEHDMKTVIKFDSEPFALG